MEEKKNNAEISKTQINKQTNKLRDRHKKLSYVTRTYRIVRKKQQENIQRSYAGAVVLL